MVTQADIARELNLSQVAVSLSLKGDQNNRVSSSTRRRVLDAARRMGYRRHNGARTLATGRFNAAAFVQREETDFMPFELVRGIEEGLTQQGMSMLFVRMPVKDLMDESGLPRFFGSASVDGLLMHEAQGTPTWVMDMIRKHQIPTIWLNDKQPFDTVYPDELAAAQCGTQTLIDAGHRRIAYVHFHLRWEHRDTPELNAVKRLAGHYSTEDRSAGYRQTMAQAGLTPMSIDRCWVAPKEREDWRNPWEYAKWQRVEIATEMLKSADRPTAILAASEQSAGPWLTAAASLGLRIPQDLSIVAITRDEYTAGGITLSVLKQPWRDVGLAGVEMLCEKVNDPDEPVPSRAIGFYQVRGLTLASPPDTDGV